MNAFVESQLAELQKAVHELETASTEKDLAIERLEAERDALQQDQWRLKKNLSTLERDAQKLKTLQTENARLKEHLQTLRGQLKDLIKEIKVIREGVPA